MFVSDDVVEPAKRRTTETACVCNVEAINDFEKLKRDVRRNTPKLISSCIDGASKSKFEQTVELCVVQHQGRIHAHLEGTVGNEYWSHVGLRRLLEKTG